MPDVNERRGGCLCGAVKITAREIGTSVGACHCRMCRRWCGGPLMAVDCGTEVSFDGEEAISVFPSSDWAERGFCARCGSHLFYRLKADQRYFVSAGIFDTEEGFVFDHQVFIDEKPALYEFSNRTHEMTGAEAFAKYGPSG